MGLVKFSEITTNHFLCIPGLPSVRIEIKDVGCDSGGVWRIVSTHGELSTMNPDRKIWAVEKEKDFA